MQERKFVFVEETLCGRGIGGVAISHEEGKINLQKKRNEMNRTRDSVGHKSRKAFITLATSHSSFGSVSTIFVNKILL